MNIRFGTSGRNRLTGTSGADLLIGLAGNDVISGGNGDDIIIGHSLVGARNEIDTLTGGRGADRFVLAGGGYLGDGAQGYALITDFSVVQRDRLVLSRGISHRYQQTRTGTEVFAGNDLVAQLRGVFLGAGAINSRTPWAEFI